MQQIFIMHVKSFVDFKCEMKGSHIILLGF